MIFSLVVMTGLEKCYITSAYLHSQCYSGERPVARGPLVCKILLVECFFSSMRLLHYTDLEPASVAQLAAPSVWRSGGREFNPRRGRQHSFMETDHEIFSTVILFLPLIQEGHLSVSGERMCTILVNRLED